MGVANVPSSYLVGVIGCQEESLSHPFVQKASGEQATNRSNYISPSTRQAPCVSDLSRARSTAAYIAVVGPVTV